MEETISPIKQRRHRQVFILLVAVCIFGFFSWNVYGPTRSRMPVGNIFINNVSGFIYIKNIYNNFVMTTEKPHLNPHDFNYILLENKTCHTSNGSVYLVVVVSVASGNFKQRQTVRETWGSIAKTNNEIKLVFMLGSAANDGIQEKINSESDTYHDIIQEDFVDSYRNLSLKSVALLKWSFTYCSSAKYVLKADDDMFVNLNYLVNVLKHRKLNNTVIGMKITGARPIQNKNSKWYTPSEMFNGTVYPPYCSGTSYVISGESVKKLYIASLNVPYFWLEDVFITGICRVKANIAITNDNGFTYNKPNPTGCEFRKRITGHRYSDKEIRKIWSEFTDRSLKCK